MDTSEAYKTAYRAAFDKLDFGRLERAEAVLDDAVSRGVIPFDPRHNAVHWAFDCLSLCREIVFSFCSMEGHATTNAVKKDGNLFYLCYFADNCMTRIDAFRDKAALLVWAYCCPFNPERREEVLTLEEVLRRLRCPVRFGLHIKSQDPFLEQLAKLEAPCFKRAETYRHLKIHRLEPKILMSPPEDSDGLPYMFPVSGEKEVKKLRQRLKQMYPGERDRRHVEKNCYIDGVLFESRPTKNEYWYYKDVARFTCECTGICVDVAASLARILRRRAPLRGKR